eukprot:PhM_4_TR13034/c0_g1_i1/m.92357
MAVQRACRTLGVKATTPIDQVKKRYRTLASKHHPDAGGDEKLFQEISSAYETMKDFHLAGGLEKMGAAGVDDHTNYYYDPSNPFQRQTHNEGMSQQFHMGRPGSTSSTRERRTMRSCMWDFNIWEVILPMGALGTTAVCMTYVYAHAHVYGTESTRQLFAKEGRDMTPLLEKQHRENEANERLHQELMESRRRTQTRFKDLREYIFVHDTAASSARALFRSEGVVPDDGPGSIDDGLCELQVLLSDLGTADPAAALASIVQTHEFSDAATCRDIPRAMELVTNGIWRVPGCHPQQYHATEVHYRDAAKRIPTKCLVRVVGDKDAKRHAGVEAIRSSNKLASASKVTSGGTGLDGPRRQKVLISGGENEKQPSQFTGAIPPTRPY